MDHYPKRYKGRQPIAPYRANSDALQKRFEMTKAQQEAQSMEFRNLSERRRKEIQSGIPGEKVPGCTCKNCKTKPRADKGISRPVPFRRSSIGDQEEDSTAPYASMETRQDLAAVETPTKRKHYRRKHGHGADALPDPPRDLQASGDTFAWSYVNSLMHKMVQTISATHLPGATHTCSAALVMKFDVNQSSMNGGRLAKEDLIRSKPLVIRMGSDRTNFVELLNLFSEDTWKNGKEVFDVFGAGKEAMVKVTDFCAQKKEKRSKVVRKSKDPSEIMAEALKNSAFADIVHLEDGNTKATDDDERKPAAKKERPKRDLDDDEDSSSGSESEED
ncbi:MAG: hypothetical protein SGARI_002365 [Bacillariaceae sp.]